MHHHYWLFLGNIAHTKIQGIALSRFHTAEPNMLASVHLAGAADQPNFLTIHPSGRILYAVTAAKLAEYTGAVEAFAIDASTGNLTHLNRQPSSGENPCHLAVHPDGNLLVVANYDGATIAAFPIAPDGRLHPPTAIIPHTGSSIDPKRQTKAYPHCVTFDSTGKFAYITDLGADSIFIYHVDANRGTLTPATPALTRLPAGSGPRHLVLDSADRFAYVINELTSTLTTFARSADGSLREIETIAPWAGKEAIPNTGSEIEIHPTGRWLYASNRGYNSLAICSIDAATGKLSLIAEQPTGGKTPRHFAIDPSGQFLIAANLRSDSLIAFRIHPETGLLTATGAQTPADAPLCVAFLPIAR